MAVCGGRREEGKRELLLLLLPKFLQKHKEKNKRVKKILFESSIILWQKEKKLYFQNMTHTFLNFNVIINILLFVYFNSSIWSLVIFNLVTLRQAGSGVRLKRIVTRKCLF